MNIPYQTRYKSHHNISGLIGRYYPPQRVTEADFLNFLNEKPQDVPRAIYVHTPYCDKICSFCNLNREQLRESLDEYAEYIVSEFEKYGKYRYFQEKGVDVIYFGGGTPTVYKDYQLEKILIAIKNNIKFNEGYEFTFETTLHNLTQTKLELLKRYGVNRFSIGVQSFSEEGRKFYNRTYGKEEVISKIQYIKDSFDGEVCIDIIYNYPNQKIESVIEDARIIKKLELSSSSFYSLMVHEGSALSKDIKDEKVRLEESITKERELHDAFVEELLSDDRYHILELTKIARKGGDSYKYIKTRNLGGDTFPIGVGAGGSVGNIGVFRMKKEMSVFVKKGILQERLERITGLFQFPIIEKEKLYPLITENERERFDEIIEKLKSQGLIEENEKELKLTKDGFFWGNNLSREIIEELIKLNITK